MKVICGSWVVFTVLLISSLLMVLVQRHEPSSLGLLGGRLQLRTSGTRSNEYGNYDPVSWSNLLLEESNNYTATLQQLLGLNETIATPCYNESTNFTKLELGGLPKKNGRVVFATNTEHTFTLVTYSSDGKPRCAGGDYFEVDLHNEHYRSRLPTIDYHNGSYGLELIVPSQFAGYFILEIWLLFTNWHGMDQSTESWAVKQLFLEQDLELLDDSHSDGLAHENLAAVRSSKSLEQEKVKSQVDNPKRCTQADFNRKAWAGRWTRSWFNSSCVADNAQKRFRCLPEHLSCTEPWCFGRVGLLDSNGWVYSAHCSFKIFERDEAWKCLNGRWFLIWGDSNFQDTMRNLLIFVMDWSLPPGTRLADFTFERSYEKFFVNPTRLDQWFHVSSVFNGHHIDAANGEGLDTMKDKWHQKRLLAHFSGDNWPDTIIMNSGLHDGNRFHKFEDFLSSADNVIDWWKHLYSTIPADRRPEVIWRTTVAPAGTSRSMAGNPNKLEMYNQVIVEKLQQVREDLPVKIIDTFDLTFPFHYDNNYSDGGHYGRAPGTHLAPWHGKPHWYFVDIMLAHIFLNAVCKT